MSGLAKTGLKAVKWSTLTTVARFALQLLAQVVLARLLGPEVYGVFGLGMVVLTFATFVSNLGLGASLLYRENISDRDIRFAFSWQMLAGASASLCLWLAAPWVADFFHEPRAIDVVRWLGLTCLISSAGTVAGALAQRALKFRQNGLIQVGSYALGYLGVGVPMALMGHTISALVAAWLVQACTSTLALVWLQPHPMQPLFHYEGNRAAAAEGRNLMFTNVVNWLLGNIDKVLVGRLMSAHSVGLYNVSFNLALMPSTMLLGTLQPTLTALYGQAKDDLPRVQAAYLQSLSLVGVLLLPAFVTLAVMAPDLLPLLYGNKWTDAGPILAVLFLTVPAYLAQGVSTPLLWTFGRTLALDVRPLAPLLARSAGIAALTGAAALLGQMLGRAAGSGGLIQLATPVVSVLSLHFTVWHLARWVYGEETLKFIFQIIASKTKKTS
ncbi:MAG: polysaccharide biosynthesis protein [Ideonella sp. MAG2]|nr:MAG: polysaccharide biosynthesis protein [Ideonella sp. MAG2]